MSFTITRPLHCACTAHGRSGGAGRHVEPVVIHQAVYKGYLPLMLVVERQPARLSDDRWTDNLPSSLLLATAYPSMTKIHDSLLISYIRRRGVHHLTTESPPSEILMTVHMQIPKSWPP